MGFENAFSSVFLNFLFPKLILTDGVFMSNNKIILIFLKKFGKYLVYNAKLIKKL